MLLDTEVIQTAKRSQPFTFPDSRPIGHKVEKVHWETNHGLNIKSFGFVSCTFFINRKQENKSKWRKVSSTSAD